MVRSVHHATASSQAFAPRGSVLAFVEHVEPIEPVEPVEHVEHVAMITLFMWFFLGCGLFQVASAFALHAGVRVPPFMSGRTAFGQLCQGTAGLFLAELCATTHPGVITWVLAFLIPVLVLVGVRADRATARRRSARSA